MVKKVTRWRTLPLEQNVRYRVHTGTERARRTALRGRPYPQLGRGSLRSMMPTSSSSDPSSLATESRPEELQLNYGSLYLTGKLSAD